MFKNLVTATESVDVNLTDSDMTSISTEVLNTLLNNQMASDPQADAYFGLKSDLMSAKNLLSILSETSDPTSVLAVANGAGDISTISPAYESFLQGTTALTPNLDSIKADLTAAIAAGDIALEGFWMKLWKGFLYFAVWAVFVVVTVASLILLTPITILIAAGLATAGIVATGAATVTVLVGTTVLSVWLAKCVSDLGRAKTEADREAIQKVMDNLKKAGENAYKKINVLPAKNLLTSIDTCIRAPYAIKELIELKLPTKVDEVEHFTELLRLTFSDTALAIEEKQGSYLSGNQDQHLVPPKKSGDMKQLGYDKNIEKVLVQASHLHAELKKVSEDKVAMKKRDVELTTLIKRIEDDNFMTTVDKDKLTAAHAGYKSLISVLVANSNRLLTETTRQLKLIHDTWLVEIEDPTGVLK